MSGPAFFTAVWRPDLPRALALRESLAQVYHGAACSIAVYDRPGAAPPPLPDILTIEDLELYDPEWWLFIAPHPGPLELTQAIVRAFRRNQDDLYYVAPTLVAQPGGPGREIATAVATTRGLPLIIHFPASGLPARLVVTEAPDEPGPIVESVFDVGPIPPPFVNFSAYNPATASWLLAEGAGLAARRHLRAYEAALARHATPGDREAARRLGTFDNGDPIPPIARTIAGRVSRGERRAFGSPYRTGPGSFYEAIREGDAAIPVARRLWLAAWETRPDVRAAMPDPTGQDRERFLDWCAAEGRTEHDVPAVLAPPSPRGPVDRPEGVNVIGLLASDTGQGSAARGLAHAVAAAGGRAAGLRLVHPEAGSIATRYATEGSAPYSTNVFVMNGRSTGEALARLRGHFSPGQRRVAYWMWETDRLPESWAAWASSYDEIWAVSNYTAAAIRCTTGIDPVVVPHAIEPREAPGAPLTRAQLGVPDDAVVFLFMFDYLSRIERKNPLGLVEAFRRAFGGDRRAFLLLKTSRAGYDAQGAARLKDAIAGMPNAALLDVILSTPRRFYDLADCYVSLHRSEGFGLTMAEAMAAGKPVIATGYSGNLDFMSSDNAHLVPYELREIPGGCGPYPAGDHWAEPDLDAAAAAMRSVFDDPESARELGRQGQAAVGAILDPVRIGTMVCERVHALSQTPVD